MPGNFHEVPASVVASWPKPNYVDPVRRTWLPILALFLVALSTLLVAGRFYMRAKKQAGTFGLDDVFIAIAWAFAVLLSASACVDADKKGIDRHTWDVPLEDYVGAALVGWIAQLLMLISCCATKFSVLLFHRRLVKDIGNWIWAIWSALAFTACYFVATLIAYCLLCRPLDSYWLSYDLLHPYTKHYKCIDGNAFSVSIGVLSVISDLYAVFLPMVVLRKYDLDVPRRQRRCLNIIFGLGALVAGAGIARTYYLWKINNSYDTSWTGFDLFVWALLECHGAIICASAPSMRAFFRRYLGDSFNRAFRSSGSSRTKQWPSKSGQSSSTPHDDLADLKSSEIAQKLVDNAAVVEKGQVLPHSYFVDTARRSTDTMPRIRSVADYEAFSLRQLNSSRHAYKNSNRSNSFTHDPTQWPEPGKAVRMPHYHM